jgi:hypothetical protein
MHAASAVLPEQLQQWMQSAPGKQRAGCLLGLLLPWLSWLLLLRHVLLWLQERVNAFWGYWPGAVLQDCVLLCWLSAVLAIL